MPKEIFMKCKVFTLRWIASAALAALFFASDVQAANPIVEGKGLCDPHALVVDGRVYLFATHDFSPDAKRFTMKDWWVWSSDDLLNWRLESTLKPEETFIGKPFNDCWATFGVCKDGKYYWYFSAGPKQIGVAVADSPGGPWKEPLGKPLVPEGLTHTQARDPDVLMDDDGKAYMIFGTFNYFIVRLNEDMISLAETPRPVVVQNAEGVHGKGKTDDKPSLHKRNGIYYLSYGCFYAMSENLYGPYVWKGSVVDPKTVAPEFSTHPADIFKDRHGNFFEFNKQWYYVCNDRSQPGRSMCYRDSIISYVHYKDNGEMAPVRIDRIGVGQYDATRPRIEAEDYFKAVKAEQRECSAGGFEVRGLAKGSELYFPNVLNLPPNSMMTISVASADPKGGLIEVREGLPDGKLIGSIRVPNTGGWDNFQSIACPLKNAAGRVSLCIVFKESEQEFCRLDWLAFAPRKE